MAGRLVDLTHVSLSSPNPFLYLPPERLGETLTITGLQFRLMLSARVAALVGVNPGASIDPPAALHLIRRVLGPVDQARFLAGFDPRPGGDVAPGTPLWLHLEAIGPQLAAEIAALAPALPLPVLLPMQVGVVRPNSARSESDGLLLQPQVNPTRHVLAFGGREREHVLDPRTLPDVVPMPEAEATALRSTLHAERDPALRQLAFAVRYVITGVAEAPRLTGPISLEAIEAVRFSAQIEAVDLFRDFEMTQLIASFGPGG